MIWSDDPIRDSERHNAKQDAWLESRPVCAECCEHIQADHYFDINGEAVCPDCLENYYRKETEDWQ